MWRACLRYQLQLRYLIGIGVFTRRYIIVAEVLTTVVMMVYRLGADTVSVMLNTVATLYIGIGPRSVFPVGRVAGNAESACQT